MSERERDREIKREGKRGVIKQRRIREHEEKMAGGPLKSPLCDDGVGGLHYMTMEEGGQPNFIKHLFF